ncbi:MAG: hypothetical protein HRU11_03055 [Parvularculaceae bacterium]|nr:hypothetical protein [Parvularculaceae bacterium]
MTAPVQILGIGRLADRELRAHASDATAGGFALYLSSDAMGSARARIASHYEQVTRLAAPAPFLAARFRSRGEGQAASLLVERFMAAANEMPTLFDAYAHDVEYVLSAKCDPDIEAVRETDYLRSKLRILREMRHLQQLLVGVAEGCQEQISGVDLLPLTEPDVGDHRTRVIVQAPRSQTEALQPRLSSAVGADSRLRLRGPLPIFSDELTRLFRGQEEAA